MIDKYLLSVCLLVIDEFNAEYKGLRVLSTELDDAAYRYTEADLIYRVAAPFKNQPNFSVYTPKGKGQGYHDIEIRSKDFNLEIKYLKTLYSNKGSTKSNKVGWKAIQKDLDWLQESIEGGRKGKDAVVMGWFNSTERFSQQMQLGETENSMLQEISPRKEVYFPFIDYNKSTRSTLSTTYKYKWALVPMKVGLPLKDDKQMNCMFLGCQDDKFHIALYY